VRPAAHHAPESVGHYAPAFNDALSDSAACAHRRKRCEEANGGVLPRCAAAAYPQA